MVFLLGAPQVNRGVKTEREKEKKNKPSNHSNFTFLQIIAQRLTRNRHLAVAHGGPIAVEFDECVPSELRALIKSGVPLSDAQLEAMTDAVIARVQAIANERPVIFSAFLPLRRVRQRFFAAFEDKTIIRLVCPDAECDESASAAAAAPARTPRGDAHIRRESTAGDAFPRATHDDAASAPPPDAVVVPEIDDKYDLNWRATDAELGLEALAMLEKATDDALHCHHAGDADAQQTRMRLRLAWLNGQFEEIEPEHIKVVATRSLHDVARDVRMSVSKRMLTSSKRKAEAASPSPAAQLDLVGGVRGVVGVALAGAIAGGFLAALRSMKN